jgi:hypothetical protein
MRILCGMRCAAISVLHGCQDGPSLCQAVSSWLDENPDPGFKHRDDIFEIQKSSGDCNLCKVIFQAFEKRKVANVGEARGLPIVFRAFGNKIEVCYDTDY